MSKWRTRNDQNQPGYGKHYEVTEPQFPTGRRRGSGQDLPAQQRSVSSMKSPEPNIGALQENAYQVELSKLNHAYLDGEIDKETYDAARNIMTNNFTRYHSAMNHDKAIWRAKDLYIGKEPNPSPGRRVQAEIEFAGHISDLNERTDLQLVTDSQDVRALEENLGIKHEFDGYFVKIENGEYTEVYGYPGSVPDLYKAIYRVKVKSNPSPGILGAIGKGLADVAVGVARTAGRATGAAISGYKQERGRGAAKPKPKPKPEPEAEEETEEEETEEEESAPGELIDSRHAEGTGTYWDPEWAPGEMWIQGAVKSPGSYRASVKRRHGKAGFTETGRIRESVIAADVQKPGKLGQRARFARTVRKL